MNSKTARKYNLIIEINELTPENSQLPVLLAELCAIDFQTAFEMWEFMLGKHQNSLTHEQICANIEEKPFGMFMRISETKTKQLLVDSLPLMKLIYGTCASSATGTNLAFLVNLILGAKIEIADEILRCVRTNPTPDSAERMRLIVDTIFGAYCAKYGVKVPVVTKKQEKLLLGHIEKITGPNKKLLTQRIKEIAK